MNGKNTSQMRATQERRRSNAATKHADRRTKRSRTRERQKTKALQEYR